MKPYKDQNQITYTLRQMQIIIGQLSYKSAKSILWSGLSKIVLEIGFI